MMQPKNPFLLTAFSECSSCKCVCSSSTDGDRRKGRKGRHRIHPSCLLIPVERVWRNTDGLQLRKSYLAKGESVERAV